MNRVEAATARPVVTISSLEFRYPEGEFRLVIPSLEIGQGATAAFIGPSGCGKTTLLNLIAGIAAPQAGRIETSGVDVTGLSDSACRDFRIANIGLVFQEFELLEYLTVLDNILLSYRINPSLKLERSVRERAEGLAQRVGIAEHLPRHPDQLSQGERQRVAVCRAVLPDPALLLADEPTGNLDPANKGRVMDILFDYAQESQATLITVTHDHELLSRFERTIDFKRFGQLAGDSDGEAEHPETGNAAGEGGG